MSNERCLMNVSITAHLNVTTQSKLTATQHIVVFGTCNCISSYLTWCLNFLQILLSLYKTSELGLDCSTEPVY